MTFVHDEEWCWAETPLGAVTNYVVNWGREFRYDGSRARYLVRDLNVTDFKNGTNTASSEVWSDYDGNTLYGDFDPGSGATTASYQPGMWQSIGGSDDYLHNDMLGTLRLTTIGSGPDVGTPGLARAFTAFGEKIAGPQDRNGFAGAWGYQTHTEFDFQHVGARYYDPSSGRFLQRDPIGVFGGFNVYEYTDSIPTAFVDPSGLGKVGVLIKTVKGIWKAVSKGTAVKRAKKGGDTLVTGNGARKKAKQIAKESNPGKRIVHHTNDPAPRRPHYQPSTGGPPHSYYVPGAALGTDIFGDNFFGQCVNFFNPLSDAQDIVDLVTGQE